MIFWIPSFYSESPAHGGELRSSQVGEYIDETHKAQEVVRLSYKLTKKQLLFYAVARLLMHWQMPSKRLGNIRQFAENFKAYLDLRSQNKSKEEQTIVYWESTKDFAFAYLLKKLPFKIIVLPHNVESLVIYGRQNPVDLFQKEIKALSHCHEILTISEKDAEILRKAKLEAECLPFKLCKASATSASQLRKKREKSQKESFLIIGSATDPATLVGMNKLLEMIKDPALQNQSFKIIGKSTELLREKANKNCHLMGWLTTSEFDEQLARAKAVIIYHPASSGYLTRIEFLKQAKVPVFINREYAEYKKLDSYCSTYTSAQELAKLIHEHT